MAQKRKRTKRGKQKATNLIKRWTLSVLWIIVTLTLIYLIARLVNADRVKADIQNQQITKSEFLQMVVVPENIPNEIVEYSGYTVYFNSDLHIPNCTVYELLSTETEGDVPRHNKFHCDENVKGCADYTDYKNSGYDRGHMVPAGDMKWNYEAMKESFFMTNICPQAKQLNSGAWNKLETKVRTWSQRDSALIIITGPIIYEPMERIGNIGVAVPREFFKIVMAPFVDKPRAIAFIYPNEKSKGNLESHTVSVDEVERRTGLDFFSSLDDQEEALIESNSNLKLWEQK